MTRKLELTSRLLRRPFHSQSDWPAGLCQWSTTEALALAIFGAVNDRYISPTSVHVKHNKLVKLVCTACSSCALCAFVVLEAALWPFADPSDETCFVGSKRAVRVCGRATQGLYLSHVYRPPTHLQRQHGIAEDDSSRWLTSY